jgi:alpha-soluble NSF attachment protein
VSARLANKLYLKVADVAALGDDYTKAIANYERVAAASLDNNLMKYSVKDYFLKAGICHLASGDLVSTQRAIQKYAEMDASFVSQRENLLLNDLYQAFEQGDADAFTDRLFQYDQISKLDKWKTSMLVKVKNKIPRGEASEASGVADEDEVYA